MPIKFVRLDTLKRDPGETCLLGALLRRPVSRERIMTSRLWAGGLKPTVLKDSIVDSLLLGQSGLMPGMSSPKVFTIFGTDGRSG